MLTFTDITQKTAARRKVPDKPLKANQDAHLYLPDQELLGVFDYMGSASGRGETVSWRFQQYLEVTGSVRKAVEKLIEEGMHRSTLELAQIRGESLSITHIGDSQTLVVRDGEVVYKTSPHNVLHAIESYLTPSLHPRTHTFDDILAELRTNPLPDGNMIGIAQPLILNGKRDLDRIFSPKFMRFVITNYFNKYSQSERDQLFDDCVNEVIRKGRSDFIIAALIATSQHRSLKSLHHQVTLEDAQPVTQVVLEDGDTVICSSDGFYENCDELDLLRLIQQYELKTALRILFKRAHRHGPHPDDTTVVAGRIRAT